MSEAQAIIKILKDTLEELKQEREEERMLKRVLPKWFWKNHN